MSQEDNSISLQTAQDWTTEWRSVESTYNKHNECNGFLIPAEDLQAVLDEMATQRSGKKKVRAYIGVDPTTNEEKLIFVVYNSCFQVKECLVSLGTSTEILDGCILVASKPASEKSIKTR